MCPIWYNSSRQYNLKLKFIKNNIATCKNPWKVNCQTMEELKIRLYTIYFWLFGIICGVMIILRTDAGVLSQKTSGLCLQRCQYLTTTCQLRPEFLDLFCSAFHNCDRLVKDHLSNVTLLVLHTEHKCSYQTSQKFRKLSFLIQLFRDMIHSNLTWTPRMILIYWFVLLDTWHIYCYKV